MRIDGRRPSPSWNECGELQSHRPMLNVEPVHGKVGDVRGCESCPDAYSRGRDQAIGLMEREPASGERPSPIARPHAFCHPQGCKTQPVEQPPCVEFFAGTQPAPDLLDGDDADPRLGTPAPKTRHTRRGRPAANESIRTVESSNKRAIVSGTAGHRLAAADVPMRPGRRPTHAPYRAGCRARLRSRPNAVRPRVRVQSAPRRTRYAF